jgi:hypothetical protein
MQSTLDEIEVFGQIFSNIEGLDESSFSIQGSCFLLASLKSCQAASPALQTLRARTLQPLKGKNRSRSSILFKAALKKEEIQRPKARMEASNRMLHLAVTCYSMYDSFLLRTTRNLTKSCRTMHEEQLALLKQRSSNLITSSEPTGLVDTFASTPPKTKPKNIALMNNPRLCQKKMCSLKSCCCVCHDTVPFQGRSWFFKFPSSWAWKSCNKATCGNAKSVSLWLSLTQLGIPLAVCASLEFMFTSSQSYITP